MSEHKKTNMIFEKEDYRVNLSFEDNLVIITNMNDHTSDIKILFEDFIHICDWIVFSK